MIQSGFPAVRERYGHHGDVPLQVAAAPVITSLGVIEGEVLAYLEVRGATPLRRLTRELAWISPLVVMAVGGLVRAGLVRAYPA